MVSNTYFEKNLNKVFDRNSEKACKRFSIKCNFSPIHLQQKEIWRLHRIFLNQICTIIFNVRLISLGWLKDSSLLNGCKFIDECSHRDGFWLFPSNWTLHPLIMILTTNAYNNPKWQDRGSMMDKPKLNA